MKIDTHQHYWSYQAQEFPWINAAMPDLQRDCLPLDCSDALQAAGIDAVVAVQARCSHDETDFLLHLVDQHPMVVGVVGWADLGAPDLEAQLQRWGHNPAFKGLRHILQDEPDVQAWANAPAHQHGMRVLQKQSGVFDVLVFAHQLHQVADFCARHDAHWLVLDHLGKPALRQWDVQCAASAQWHKDMDRLASMPHVMCKLSGLVTEADWAQGLGLFPGEAEKIWACFDYALAVFGPSRLLYGSDWPVCQLASKYDVVHGLAHTWAQTALSATEQQAFWSGNAIRCYGLNVH